MATEQGDEVVKQLARTFLALFAIATIFHLIGLLFGLQYIEDASKPALMSSLAAYAALRGAPALLVGALAFSCLGDTLLQIGVDSLFLFGMGSFAVAHACFIILFIRHGQPHKRVRLAMAALLYGGFCLVMLTLLLPALGRLGAPIILYCALLATTAVFATSVSAATAFGGAMFLISDLLLATRLAGWEQLDYASFWVMASYLCAQIFLSAAFLRGRHNVITQTR